MNNRPDEQTHRRKLERVEQTIVAPTKALVATAGNLLGTSAKSDKDCEKKDKSNCGLNIPSNMPCLGDDFYMFEKYFGVPRADDIVASKTDLTWVRYPARNCFADILVASRASTGKAD